MEKEKIKVAMLQMSSVVGDVEANIEKVQQLTDKFLSDDIDVLVLPEVWTVGWACHEFRSSAQNIGGGIVFNFLSSLAKKYDVNIIGGSCVVCEGEKYYNTCPVFDRDGNLIALYSKLHLYSYYGCNEADYISSGEYPIMVELDGVKFGLTICYDIRFPELYRAYAEAGADVLVNCAAWGSKKPIPWEIMTKSRAVENQSYMIALTQSGHIIGDEYNLGQSRIIDYKGEDVATIMQGEGIVSAILDLQEMRSFRAKAPTISDIRNSYEVKVLCEKF